VITLRDEFLSDEDLDLRTMTEAELYAYWDMWLRQAQATNDLDRHTYSHGVFRSAPEAAGDATPELGATTSASSKIGLAAKTG
jgi:hypothetical protein